MALIVLGMAWAAWRIVGLTASLNASDPELALAWTPSEASALDELASREVTKPGGDLNAAKTLAERALRSNPIDARALSALALIAERAGDQARADNLMDLSGALTWHDVATQAWLINRKIRKGEFDQAFSHIDALLRANPELFGQVFPILSAFAIDQRTFEVLARNLAADPPWRTGFLIQLSSQPPDAARPDAGRLVRLYEALKNSAHPPTTRELRSYLDRLIHDGRLAEAYKSWRETLPAAQRTREFYLYNGDFIAPIDGLPFNWRLEPALGMNVQVVTLPGKESRAIQLQFSGARVAPFTVGQLMLLPPGEYRLIGKVRAEELRTPQGLGWHIYCASPASNTLARTSLVTGTVPWTNFAVDFRVLPDCPGQWLKLELPSRTASERQIEGQIWYENIRIERIRGPSQPTGAR